jgi:hypothetical protein
MCPFGHGPDPHPSKVAVAFSLIAYADGNTAPQVGQIAGMEMIMSKIAN